MGGWGGSIKGVTEPNFGQLLDKDQQPVVIPVQRARPADEYDTDLNSKTLKSVESDAFNAYTETELAQIKLVSSGQNVTVTRALGQTSSISGAEEPGPEEL